MRYIHRTSRRLKSFCHQESNVLNVIKFTAKPLLFSLKQFCKAQMVVFHSNSFRSRNILQKIIYLKRFFLVTLPCCKMGIIESSCFIVKFHDVIRQGILTRSYSFKSEIKMRTHMLLVHCSILCDFINLFFHICL